MAAVTTIDDVRAAHRALYPDGRFQNDPALLTAWFSAFKSFKPSAAELEETNELAVEVLYAIKARRTVKAAAAAGGRRKTFKKKRLMSKKYCKKTPCKRMGFTQKASCRPYKNCYLNK
jgi:hypothetical protein